MKKNHVGAPPSFIWTAACWGRLQAGSDTAVCEDLRELRDEAEGVRLRLKRSRASFRLDVLSWDSDPESWDCCEGAREKRLWSVSAPCLHRNQSSHSHRPRIQADVSPCLLLSLVVILQCRVPCAVLLLLQHNCRAQTGIKTNLYVHCDWSEEPLLCAEGKWCKYHWYLTTVCVQTINSGLEFHWW